MRAERILVAHAPGILKKKRFHAKYWPPKLTGGLRDIIFFLMYLESGNITVSGHAGYAGKGFFN